MFTIKKQLTNTRPPKSTKPSITTSPTNGTMRLSQAGAEAMDIVSGDYIAVIEAETEEGLAMFAVKGHGGVDGEANFGSKVAGSNGKKSGTLQFSSSNTYASLGGEAENTHEWLLDVEGAVEHEGAVYFKLIEGEVKAKAKRGAVADEEDSE